MKLRLVIVHPMRNSKILLGRRNNARGPAIPVHIYDMISCEILKVLHLNEPGIDLRELIDQLRSKLLGTCRGDLQWYILRVKEDMEQRGWIRTKVNRDHVQIVGLTRSGSTSSNMRAQLYNE